MLKGRVWLWVIMLVVTLIVSWLIQVVPGWFESSDLHVQIDIASDADFAQVIANQKIKKIKPILTSESPDLIITDKTSDIAGYTKYENYISSPIIAWACGVSYESDGFVQAPNVSNTYKLDLFTVLKAIEDGKSWEDLGFSENVINGPVTLYIPSPQCSYYNSVVELFRMTLSNGDAITDANREEIEQRVNTIVGKCHKVADVTQAIIDEYKNPSDTHKIFVGPEYIYKRGRDSAIGYGNEMRKQYRPVYFFKTIFVEASVFVKNDGDNVELANKFVENMRQNKEFMSKTGWRVKNIEYDIWDVSNIYYKTP